MQGVRLNPCEERREVAGGWDVKALKTRLEIVDCRF
jgi:hypothetical protein